MSKHRDLRPILLFCGLLLCLSVLFLPRIIALAPLYADAQLRTTLQEKLQTIANQQGWLVSDLTLVHVRSGRVRFEHVPHGEQRYKGSCYELLLPDSILTPCAK